MTAPDRQEPTPMADSFSSLQAPEVEWAPVLSETLHIKDLANDLFRQHHFVEALDEYEEALRICPKQETLILAVLHANLAACYAKLDQHDQVIASCTEALQHSPVYEKALYRRAAAYEHNSTAASLTAALEDYTKLQNLPNVSPEASARCSVKLAQLPLLISQTEANERVQAMGT
ncbi:Mitochondrial import receptor subunit TOM70 [Dimargaris xerosporica]|nr:Mitochondrial import receptor subunit TOM70 [Dimargaris xerosporica]